MSHGVHRCDTPEGPRYRVWSSVVDAYLTEPMTRTEMARHLAYEFPSHNRRRHHDEIEKRLARCDVQGTSVYGGQRTTTMWDAERCAYCAKFHHSYWPDEDAACALCGEHVDNGAHRGPCRG